MMFRKLMVAVALLAVAGFASGDATMDKLNDLAKNKLQKVFEEASVVAAIKAQNVKNSGLAQGDIDKLDKQWRAEAKNGKGPLIDSVLANALSKKLKAFKDSGQGLFTEIFVMDNKGLNVGQSDVTSDYWQGDEAKWQKTYKKGPGAVFVDGVELDESTQTYQSQVSLTIVDPATNQAVGAVTVGVNVEALQ